MTAKLSKMRSRYGKTQEEIVATAEVSPKAELNWGRVRCFPMPSRFAPSASSSELRDGAR